LIAVPTTAILMMFFREWEKTLHASVQTSPTIVSDGKEQK